MVAVAGTTAFSGPYNLAVWLSTETTLALRFRHGVSRLSAAWHGGRGFDTGLLVFVCVCRGRTDTRVSCAVWSSGIASSTFKRRDAASARLVRLLFFLNPAIWGVELSGLVSLSPCIFVYALVHRVWPFRRSPGDKHILGAARRTPFFRGR